MSMYADPDQFAGLEGVLDDLLDGIAKVAAEHLPVKDTHRRIADLEAKNASLAKENDELREQLNTHIRSAVKQPDELRSEIADLREQLHALHTEYRQFRENAAQDKNKLAAANDKEVERLTKEIRRLIIENRRQAQRISELVAIDPATEKRYLAQLRERDSRIGKLHKDLTAAQNQRDSYRQEIARLKANPCKPFIMVNNHPYSEREVQELIAELNTLRAAHAAAADPQLWVSTKGRPINAGSIVYNHDSKVTSYPRDTILIRDPANVVIRISTSGRTVDADADLLYQMVSDLDRAMKDNEQLAKEKADLEHRNANQAAGIDELRSECSYKRNTIADLNKKLRIVTEERNKAQDKVNLLMQAADGNSYMTTPLGMLPINQVGMRAVVDALTKAEAERARFESALTAVADIAKNNS